MSLHTSPHKPVILWLYACAAMVFAMMIIGAITRLTESGLSMVEWRPLIGAIPPLNDVEWQRVFEIYKETPEYQQKNFWMGIEDFKTIFFWEWFHRFWGRMIGLVFALPLAFFALRKMIPKNYGLKFLGMLILGGLQGVMGWYMVESGLVDVPAVSHFRLAAHLSLAFIIFALLLWLAFSLHVERLKTGDKQVFTMGLISLAAISVTIIWGAFTAGLDGGLIYNSWPKMGENFIPSEISDAGWSAAIDNPAGVQFTHRWIAIIAALSVLAFWGMGIKRNVSYTLFHTMAFMVGVQVLLGIVTLLSSVNIILATLHQAGAAALIAFMIFNLYKLKPA